MSELARHLIYRRTMYCAYPSNKAENTRRMREIAALLIGSGC